MGFVLRASLAGVTLTGVACGTGFSSNGSGGGGSDAATADVVVANDSGSDASTESGPDDGGSSHDGSVHDGPAGDGPTLGETGPGQGWCATHPAQFCEDFDKFANVTPFLSSWTTYSTIGGSFSFDGSNVPSGPNALAVATTSTSGVRTLVIHAMSGATAGVTKQRLEFDLLIDDASNIGALSAAAVAAIVFGSDVNAGAVALAFGNGPSNTTTLGAVYLGPSVEGGLPAFGSANAPPPFPTLGQWDGRFAIEIDYGPVGPPTDGAAVSTACAQLFVGGNPQLSPCLALPPVLSHPGPTSIALGVYSGGVGNTGSVHVAFDNVTYNAE